MDFAGEEAAPACTNIYVFDLVTHEPPKEFNLGGLGDRGVVSTLNSISTNISVPVTVSRLKLLRVDCGLVNVKAGAVTVVDRSYMQPGMVVGSASDLGGGQIGVVTGATTLLDLVRLDDDQYVPVIRGVPTSTPGLRRVRRLNLGDFVVSGPWLGRVLELSVDVDVLLGNGTVRRFTDAESKKQILEAPEHKYTANYRNDTGRYYLGQHVYGNPSAFPKHYRFLKGIVVKVEVSGVLVHWVASAHCGTDKDLVMASAPPAYQHPHDLTYFCSSSCPWAVADRCFLGAPTATGIEDDHGDHAAASSHDRHRREKQHRASSSSQSSDASWISSGEVEEQQLDDKSLAAAAASSTPPGAPAVQTKKKKSYLKQQMKLLFRQHGRRLDQFELPMSVSDTRTTVDVLWQDCTRQRGVPSTSLIPFAITNANEFFPGGFVVDNAPLPTTAAQDASAINEVAGGQDDDDGPTTTAVTTTTNGDATDGGPTRRRVGIVRSLNSKDQTVRVSWFKAAASRPHGEAGSSGEVECGDDTVTVSAYDLRRHPWFSLHPFYGDVVVRRLPSVPNDGASTKPAVQQPIDLSWVGHVVDLPDGKVLVNWGGGSTSTVLPHEVCVVIQDHYTELLEEMGEWVEDDDAPPPELAGADKQNQPSDSSNVDGGGDDPANADVPAAVLARWGLSLAAQVLAQGSRYMARWSPPPSSSSSSSQPPEAMEKVEVPAPSGSDQDQIDSGCATEASVASFDAPEEDATAFPRFDVVHSPPDHHYLDSMEQSGNGGKKWVKAVQKEWKILENGLPDTIYVRAFEDRMDLLRVVMVGASGTPYHDGLFFFDMQLPPSYPAAPPQVYYHSFGLQINPNLYPSGTVCLSLLNTFGGEGTEVWSPAASSLLQVVVSIQGLVLNDEPYYNEAGYETLVGKPEGRRNALPYSENAYLLSLRTALHLLRRPPQGFEEFVRDHFRRQGRFVLRACEAYLQGCAVGTLTDDARAAEGSMERQCSTGLKLALANMVPSLVAAFKETS